MVAEIPYVRLRPRPGSFYLSQGRTVFETDTSGWIEPGSVHGLFIHQTRLLSAYRWLVDGAPPLVVALSNVDQHSSLGYYICPPRPRAHDDELRAEPSRAAERVDINEHTVELRVSRFAGGGVHEDIDVTNYAGWAVSLTLTLEVDADFASPGELYSEMKRPPGETRRRWDAAPEDGRWTLSFDYRAEHTHDRQGDRGTARIERSLALAVHRAGSPPRWSDGRLEFTVELEPLASWHACIDFTARIEDRVLAPAYGCRSFGPTASQLDVAREAFLSASTAVETLGPTDLSATVETAVASAKRDLASLRLDDLDRRDGSWTMAAGLPMYVALFGRDTLTASWQAALAGPEMMIGTLFTLPEWQGREDNAWRDEEPGRMLHEAHTDPFSALGFTPRGRYYGAITTSAFYPVVVSELWHWTGDRGLIAPLLRPALAALEWLDRYTTFVGDGFHYYRTRSEDGNANQGWKDSGEAIVDEAGRLVRAPIATCEEQGFVYAAKLQLAEVLWWLDCRDLAKRLFHEAAELKQRFNAAFWMEDEQFLAMGLDSERRLIRSIGSNAGHCLVTGIADRERAGAVADRLMAPELWSGWGVRTLSSANPAYNPYSYHRGSIWPVENATFAVGFFRYGLWDHLHRLARAMFEACALYDHHRLPELHAGHQRDADHPFPANYAKANSPQAWSSSAVLCVVQSMLGLYPYAPLRTLLLDPHLPEWLPRLTVRGLRVGAARVTLRFSRDEKGTTHFEVLEKDGTLHLLRQPSPWSLTAGLAERAKDALTSLLPA
jgi:glycogen debranching enzyme